MVLGHVLPKFTALLLMFASLSACDQRSQAVFVEDQSSPQVRQADQVITEKALPSVPIPDASSALFRKAVGATVRLVGIDAAGVDFTGSGVVLCKDKDSLYVLTVWHVAQHGVRSVDLYSTSNWPDPAFTLTDVQVAGKPSKTADLAVLRVQPAPNVKFGSLKLSKVASPGFGYSSGCSAGSPPTVLPERIMGTQNIRVAGRDLIARMWLTGSPQELGRSGGPLLDVNGDLLGIALGKTDATQEQQGFYCHSSEISNYLIDTKLEALVLWSKLGK